MLSIALHRQFKSILQRALYETNYIYEWPYTSKSNSWTIKQQTDNGSYIHVLREMEDKNID